MDNASMDYQVGSRVTHATGGHGTVVDIPPSPGPWGGWLLVSFDADVRPTVPSACHPSGLTPLVEPLPYGPVPRGERDEVQSRLYAASAALADAFAHVVKARTPGINDYDKRAAMEQAANEIGYVARFVAEAGYWLTMEYIAKVGG